MSRREVDTASFVTESRLAQGLPPRVEDPAVLARVATLLAAARRSNPFLSPKAGNMANVGNKVRGKKGGLFG